MTSLTSILNTNEAIPKEYRNSKSQDDIRRDLATCDLSSATNPHILNLNALLNPKPKKLVSIEDVGDKFTVDIEVDDISHSYIANGCPVHNTINVPTDIHFDDFKNVYMYAYDKGLKGCTTFRFNPAAFQGVLVKEDDLKATTYVFNLEDGTKVEAAGDVVINYDSEQHTAANLYDAIKEGTYGKY